MIEFEEGVLNSRHFHKTAHDLSKVARKLNIDLAEAQRDLLERLTTFVQWASKYQVPLKKAELERASGKMKLVYPPDYTLARELIADLQRRAGFDETQGWPYEGY